MKRINYLLHLAVMLILAVSTSALVISCDNKDDEPNNGQSLDVYPWKDHPRSYIRLFDYRMSLQMLNVQRNGTALQIDYTLTNTGFGEDVTLTFVQYGDSGHDNLGNTYKATHSAGSSQVVANINGSFYGISGWGKSVTFLPNQTIKGSFMI